MSTHDNHDTDTNTDAAAAADIDIDIDELASEVAEELATQRTIGDKVLMNRREAMALGTGALGLGAVLNSAVGEAEAQEAGVLRGIDQIGTSDNPVGQLYVDNQTNYSESEHIETLSAGSFDADDATINGTLNGGGVVTDGDGTERQIWVIEAGASDPAGAAPEDIILEEES